MKFAISNIALSPYKHADELQHLADLGFTGLEVAPSRVWQDTWHGLTPAMVASYRRDVEAAGLKVLGLHSLLFDQKDMGLFADAEGRARVLDFMTHLSAVCRDLGGTTLIWGAGRWRHGRSLVDANAYATDFFQDLDNRIKDHGTWFCFEPLGSKDSDFLNSVVDAEKLVATLAVPSVGLHLDTKGIAENGEMTAEIATLAKPYLKHVHVNEPGLGILGSTGEIDHVAFAEILNGIGYGGFVSIEQRMVDPADTLGPVRQSAAYLTSVYGSNA
tara:strand:- start:70 stop:888 length:819 start_codon:yes stop_codon:yes gene_type:complete